MINGFCPQTSEQRKIYDEIIDDALNDRGGVFFFFGKIGFGGTCKTFSWKMLYADIRSRGNIVINVAFSDIVALLLECGRTTLSRFEFPTTCSMTCGSDLAELVKEASLII